MESLRKYLRQIDEDGVRLDKWVRTWGVFTAVCTGSAAAVLIAALSTLATGKGLTREIVLVAVAGGLISVVLEHRVYSAVRVWMHNHRIEAGVRSYELGIINRVGDTLGAFLFFAKSGNFEKTLMWFKQDYSHDVKILIAKVIHQQLNRAFKNDVIRMHISAYADYSSVLTDLLVGASDVCFTCIKSPSSWFLELDSDRYQHEELPQHMAPSNGADFSPDELVRNGLRVDTVDQYPSHFIRFLERPCASARRRRVFLLDQTEWQKLIAPSNREFYRKFMGPCQRAAIETRFVHVPVFLAQVVNARETVRDIAASAIAGNITTQDYAVFESTAVMVYADRAADDVLQIDTGPVLEFRVGPRALSYAEFLEMLFSEQLNGRYGVYTQSDIETLMNHVENHVPQQIESKDGTTIVEA